MQKAHSSTLSNLKGKMSKKKLTDKQKRFCDEYLVDLNVTQAAIRAGYSKRTASRAGQDALARPHVRAYIDKRLAEKDAELIAKQDEILKYLTSVMRGENVSETVVVEGNGVGITEAKRLARLPEEKDRLKAAELLGKGYGLFVDRSKMEITKPVVVLDGYDDLQD